MKKLGNSFFILSALCALIFFIISFLTLKDYGISWDETIHFRRGEAYLHYFLNGKKDYSDLKNLNLQGTKGDPKKIVQPRRSFYQNDLHNGYYFFSNDVGHPPLGDITAAFFNYIFYQKLGILNDIFSFHLFNILTSSMLVLVVVYFALETIGIFSAAVSFLTLITYPLFFAESHFNIKDPAEAAFFSAAMLFFYLSLKRSKFLLIIPCFVFLGLAMGVKFNVLFFPVIIVLYLLIYFLQSSKHTVGVLKKLKGVEWAAILIGPFLTLLIFFISWPFLWQNPLQNFVKIINYYQQIGSGVKYQPESFYLLGFNTFAAQWIFFTTPPLILFLLASGIYFAFIKRKEKNAVTILWLFWFLIPILRVTMPGSAIYGGIRQILEFLPALALLAGLGAAYLMETVARFKVNSKILKAGLILLFLWPVFVLFKLHPNENVYFNSLIGGLPGAAKKNFPSYGNSFGNAYKQGVEWINQNASESSRLSLIEGTLANAPALWLRPDISYSPENWSGIGQRGEYLMELTYNETGQSFYYTWDYVNNFLEPVYQVKVEGVPILKIWKNDPEHLKKGIRLSESKFMGNISTSVSANLVSVSLDKPVLLSRLMLSFDGSKNCDMPVNTFVEDSLDGQNWTLEKDWIPFPQVGNTNNLIDNNLQYYFAAKRAQYIRLKLDSQNSCFKNNPKAVVLFFQ